MIAALSRTGPRGRTRKRFAPEAGFAKGLPSRLLGLLLGFVHLDEFVGSALAQDFVH
jgi:hypothetical protein